MVRTGFFETYLEKLKKDKQKEKKKEKGSLKKENKTQHHIKKRTFNMYLYYLYKQKYIFRSKKPFPQKHLLHKNGQIRREQRFHL